MNIIKYILAFALPAPRPTLKSHREKSHHDKPMSNSISLARNRTRSYIDNDFARVTQQLHGAFDYVKRFRINSALFDEAFDSAMLALESVEEDRHGTDEELSVGKGMTFRALHHVQDVSKEVASSWASVAAQVDPVSRALRELPSDTPEMVNSVDAVRFQADFQVLFLLIFV